jgi:hypothetical protein
MGEIGGQIHVPAFLNPGRNISQWGALDRRLGTPIMKIDAK